jgi:DNA polymerase phi
LGFTLILQLTGTNSNRQFDKLTKTKTVESILASMNAEGIETYIDYLLNQVDEDSSEKSVHDIQAVNARRAWMIDQLGALIRNGSIPKNDEWIQLIIDWLIVNGLFVIKKRSEKSPYRAVSVAFVLLSIFSCIDVVCSCSLCLPRYSLRNFVEVVKLAFLLVSQT